jgi:hypothetical protein
VKVVLNFSFFYGTPSSWVKIRLYTENQLPKLSGSALKVCCGGVDGLYTNYVVTPTHIWLSWAVTKISKVFLFSPSRKYYDMMALFWLNTTTILKFKSAGYWENSLTIAVPGHH